MLCTYLSALLIPTLGILLKLIRHKTAMNSVQKTASARKKELRPDKLFVIFTRK